MTTDKATETPFSSAVETRLRALILAKGYTLTGLAKAMKKSRTWLIRKLDPKSNDPRPLETADVDAILAFLGEPATAILEDNTLPS